MSGESPALFVFYVFFVALFVRPHAMRSCQAIENSRKFVGKTSASGGDEGDEGNKSECVRSITYITSITHCPATMRMSCAESHAPYVPSA
jgi:hypothetical protein